MREASKAGADFFVKESVDALLNQAEKIDTVLLGCTHYPLMSKKIKEHLPADVQLLSQGNIVAKSLAGYLQRHPEMGIRLTKEESRKFFTTDSVTDFNNHARLFYGEEVEAEHVDLEG